MPGPETPPARRGHEGELPEIECGIINAVEIDSDEIQTIGQGLRERTPVGDHMALALSGRVLPVGGIKEKVLAARRHGVNQVILPKQNETNVREDLTDEIRRGLTVHFVSEVDEVLALALTPATARQTLTLV